MFHAWAYDRFIEIKSNLRREKLHRMNQGSNFYGGSFSNRYNVRAPIQGLKNYAHASVRVRMVHAKNSVTYMKNRVHRLFLSWNYYPVRKLSVLLHQNLFCSTRLTCVCWIHHIFLSAALNWIACTLIELILFLNKTACQNPHSEISEVSAKLSCVTQISLCSRQSVMGRKKIKQRLHILS